MQNIGNHKKKYKQRHKLQLCTKNRYMYRFYLEYYDIQIIGYKDSSTYLLTTVLSIYYTEIILYLLDYTI